MSGTIRGIFFLRLRRADWRKSIGTLTGWHRLDQGDSTNQIGALEGDDPPFEDRISARSLTQKCRTRSLATWARLCPPLPSRSISSPNLLQLST